MNVKFLKRFEKLLRDKQRQEELGFFVTIYCLYSAELRALYRELDAQTRKSERSESYYDALINRARVFELKDEINQVHFDRDVIDQIISEIGALE